MKRNSEAFGIGKSLLVDAWTSEGQRTDRDYRVGHIINLITA